MFKKIFPLNILYGIYFVVKDFLLYFFEEISPDRNVSSSFRLTLYLILSQLVLIFYFGFCKADTIRYINNETFPLTVIWQILWGMFFIYILLECDFSIRNNLTDKFHVCMGRILFSIFILSITVLPLSALTYGLLKVIIKVVFLLLFVVTVVSSFCLMCVDVQHAETE